MADHPSPETQATPENHARAQVFDNLVQNVFALVESNRELTATTKDAIVMTKTLTQRVDRVVAANMVLVTIVVLALFGAGTVAFALSRASTRHDMAQDAEIKAIKEALALLKGTP